MKPLPQLLNRIVGYSFYQRHAGLFLFAFILLFGVVQGDQLISYHLTLMYAMLGSWLFMLAVSGIWLLYALKCYQFTVKTFAEKQNQFLYISAALPPAIQLGGLLVMQCFLYLPVLLYATVLVSVGIYTGQFIAVAYVIVIHTTVCFLSAFLYRFHLNHPVRGETFLLHKLVNIPFTQTFPFFFLSQLLREMKVIFIVTKFFSAIFIIAFLNGFFIDTYDSRVVMLGFMASLIAHCVMVFEFRKFEETMVGFYRNLPVSSLRRWLNFALVYAMILLPEWVIFIFALPHRLHVSDAIWLPFFGTGFLIAYHCLLYKPPLDMEKYLQWVFAIAAVIFFLLLYQLYFVIILSLSLLSMYYFRRWYYKFELTEGQL